MVVARHTHGQLVILDRLREMVRLGAGLDAQGRLDRDTAERALACLERFGQRLHDMHAQSVRVVGTNTLRRAHRKQAFLERAREALGHPIEIISGIEEARLIYLGVANTVPSEPGRRLVVDIGGGSTELIIGEGFEPQQMESLHMGCVSMSLEHFAGGRISEKRFRRARTEARLELEPIQAAFRSKGWERAIGSSGTIRVIFEIMRRFDPAATAITPAGLERLIGEIVAAGDAASIKLPEVTPERAPVFPGGIAILAELFQGLGIEQMRVADGALREGLLYDMLGRLHHEDTRERAIRAMQKRYHVDVEQAERVEATAAVLLGDVQRAWQLGEERYRQLLVWAARLHEVGLDIAHSRYHQHGGYLLANADLPGFVRLEQKLLAALVAFHRRKIEDPFLNDLPPTWRVPMFKLIVLLRLAVLLNRTRSPVELPKVELSPGNDLLELKFPPAWLSANPLTEADLEQEQAWLKARGFDLRVAAVS
jgi:exopolyphosphatase/guanosine-5'-triphosphate,3'-diphosphate pyrophosphatase